MCICVLFEDNTLTSYDSDGVATSVRFIVKKMLVLMEQAGAGFSGGGGG